MQVKITEWRKSFIPELSVLHLLFKNINFKILISIILSLLKQPQCFTSYNIKFCYLLFFKFKIKLFISSIVNFHFTFLFNAVIHLLYFIPCHPFSVPLNNLHIPSHKCSICFFYPHCFPFHNLSVPF